MLAFSFLCFSTLLSLRYEYASQKYYSFLENLKIFKKYVLYQYVSKNTVKAIFYGHYQETTNSILRI